MSEQIIEVLEYLGGKFGIAIDWTTENIMPYLEELLKRYATMRVVSLGMLIALSAIFCIVAIAIYKIMSKGHKETKTNKKDTLFFEYYSDGLEITLVGAFAVFVVVVLCIASIGIFCYNITNLLEWIFIPEVPFVKEIADLIK